MIGEIKLFLAQEVIFSINELFLKVGWFIWVILKLDDEVKGMKVGSPLDIKYSIILLLSLSFHLLDFAFF